MRFIDPAFLSRASENEYQLKYDMSIYDNKTLLTKNYKTDAQMGDVNSRGLSFGSSLYSTDNIVQNINIEVQDQDKNLYTFIGPSVLSKKIMYYRFKVVLKMSLYHLNVYAGDNSIFVGHIDNWSHIRTSGVTKIKVVSILDRITLITPSVYSPSCRWRTFKNPDDCGYAGVDPDEVCDRSFKQCENYFNSHNFGGFRWLPTIADKAIKLGKETDIPR